MLHVDMLHADVTAAPPGKANPVPTTVLELALDHATEGSVSLTEL